MRIRREALYEKIWRQPMTTVARQLEVSSNYLARVCESLNVPHPPRGYWARKAAGQGLKVPPLPVAKPGEPVEWARGQAYPERASFADYSPPPPAPSPNRKPRLSHHPAVVEWLRSLESATTTSLGYLRPFKRNALDAFVTKETARSAAAFLNALFIELENRGHSIALSGKHHRPQLDVARRDLSSNYRTSDSWSPGQATIATVADIPIGLSLFELTEHMRVRRVGTDRYVRLTDLPRVHRYAPQSPHEADESKDMATGRLVLRAYSPLYDAAWSQEWEESAAGDFGTRVSEIALALEAAAPQIAQLAAEAERRERERRRAAEAERRVRLRKERQQARAEARRKGIEELRAIAKSWRDARALDDFFDELRRRGQQMEPDQRANLESQIALARKLIDPEDAIERFIGWEMPSQVDPEDEEDF